DGKAGAGGTGLQGHGAGGQPLRHGVLARPPAPLPARRPASHGGGGVAGQSAGRDTTMGTWRSFARTELVVPEARSSPSPMNEKRLRGSPGSAMNQRTLSSRHQVTVT